MTIITIPGAKEKVEDVGLPAIPEGDFLAIVTSVEQKLNADTGAYGMNWQLLVNTGLIADGWDREARTVALKHYTYIGKLVNGTVSDTSNMFSTAEMMKALNFLNGSIDTEQVPFRQVMVKIVHKPDDDGNKWPRVKKASKYEINGEIAPVLQHLKEAAEASEPANGATKAEDEF